MCTRQKMSRVVDLFLVATLCLGLYNAAVDGLPVENFSPQRQRVFNQPIQYVPEPDGMLHVYALPVGQGDSHVLQCPSGTLSIIDLGTSNNEPDGYWFTSELQTFFQGQYNKIRNVVLTHNHWDHYRFIPAVLNPDMADLSGLTNVYAARTYDDLVTLIKDWLNQVSTSKQTKLRLFNNGQPCGPNGVSCQAIDLCPDDPDVVVKVMSANIEPKCAPENKNIDSIVFKVTYGDVSIMFNGDFEDCTSSWTEDGPQKSLVDYYGEEMHATVYKLSHHGAQNLANKPVSRDAIAPKAIFVSGNPWYSGKYYHPRCDVTDAFVNDVKSVCQPGVTDVANPLYCGLHPYDNLGLPLSNRVQQVYTCGFSGGVLRTDVDNPYAIYSTVPDEQTLNVVELVIDGQRNRWGFVNNFLSKIIRQSEPTKLAGDSDHVIFLPNHVD